MIYDISNQRFELYMEKINKTSLLFMVFEVVMSFVVAAVVSVVGFVYGLVTV